MTGTSVRVISHSINTAGEEIATVVARYQRFIHGEVMTHKDFSRNASSSRAIPFKTMLKSIWNDMACPIHWGANQPGMQAQDELTGLALWWAKSMWVLTGRMVLILAWLMNLSGVHKQVINRMIEPWSYINVQITATSWDRFYTLRIHGDAQPEIHDLAWNIRSALKGSKPVLLQRGEWHLPWIKPEERNLALDVLLKVSAARSARLSYTQHGSPKMHIGKDVALADKLLGTPPHMSPFEHQAQATPGEKHANLQGWMNQRTKSGD